MRKTKLAMHRAVNLILCILAVLSTLLQLVSFASQGWGIWTDKISKRTVYVGLWYSVVCDSPSGYCASISHHEEHQKNIDQAQLERETQYALRVWGQIIVTFAVLFSITGSVFVFLSCRKSCHVQRYNFGATLSLICSGLLLIAVIGHWTAEITSLLRILDDNSRNIYHFPWSLLVGFLGAVMALLIGICKLVFFCIELQPGDGSGRSDSTYIPMTSQGPVSTQSIPNTEERSLYPVQDKAKDDYISQSNYNKGDVHPQDTYKTEYPSLDMEKPELISNCDQQQILSDCSVKSVL